MQTGLSLALQHDAASTWLAQAVCRSAEAAHTVSAQILYGYFALRGLHGFACNAATGKAWLDAAARRTDPPADQFCGVGMEFLEAGRMREAFDIFQAGHGYGNAKCARELGNMYEAGEHVEADVPTALRYYREAMDVEGGDATAALNAALMHTVMCESATTEEELAHHEAQAIATVLRAHELADDSALDRSFQYIAQATVVSVRRKHMAWVKQHADKGNAIAMAAWAAMLGSRVDKELYDRREAIRWLMGAQAIAPDEEYVQDAEAFLQGTGWLSRGLYRLSRRFIGAHEVPGTDNAMV